MLCRPTSTVRSYFYRAIPRTRSCTRSPPCIPMSTAPVTKKPRTAPLIGTHSGTFHADEALAVFLLRLLPEYGQAEIVRSRDPAVLDECTVVVDVGGTYEPERLRFDHHQRGFNETFGHGFVTKLSSAGLVYKHFGRAILSHVLDLPQQSPSIDTLYLKLYADFVEAFDGIDNGIAAQSGPSLYKSRTDISSRIGHLNPRWNEPHSDAILDERFLKASHLAGTELLERVDYTAKAWLPAREIVLEALQSRKGVHGSGRILLFSMFAPWKEHLHLLEQELCIPESERPWYVLYPEGSDMSGKWRVQAVPMTQESFESRYPLPEVWRGVRDDALSKLTGIDGCIFVHAAGFIGGNQSKEGAMKMAIEALHF
ncbi:BZ3500_MvSof-1268-A1-R1_Chr10-2g02879 [Microbotryum saponariae]|uniref:BZ3500_MvSof-1268-A1-R1_Chr10-2g02879 protein n=1 Tax=Microbotryum saponariae TaxID=289078 RepID=A0A2X0L4U8_9BASI|nr:BZ3501_MvSof-1269-A2-R1_Chr10-2g02465 [Microbotryum saponariae]SDA01661.1 BZ3500_MvSof-1268-A1-R1_Chr10-2g02879 [Microbotryum saponariae]